MVIRRDTKCISLVELDSSGKNISKMTYFTIFYDKYLKKNSFSRSPLATVLDLCTFYELAKLAFLASKLD